MNNTSNPLKKAIYILLGIAGMMIALKIIRILFNIVSGAVVLTASMLIGLISLAVVLALPALIVFLIAKATRERT